MAVEGGEEEEFEVLDIPLQRRLQQASADDLPDEVLVAVFALLEPIHTAAVTLTCRRWRAVFHSDPPLWRAFHERLIGGPLVPALITGPALPSYYACAAGDQIACQLGKQMRAVDREAWFNHDEWRAAVEWKVSRVREWGVTPEGRIEWAALLGCSRLLTTLLMRHWHALSSTGRVHETVTKALRAAACANDADSVEMLLQRGACASGIAKRTSAHVAHERLARSPLMEAARWGNVALLRLLLPGCSGKIDVQADTPMLVASSLGHTEVVRCLLETYGFRCAFIAGSPRMLPFASMPDSEGRSALCRAARGGHIGVVQLFVPALLGKMAPWEPSNALWSAAKEGHNNVISYLLDCGVVPASPSPISAYARLPRGTMQLPTLIRLIEAVPDAEGDVWTEMTGLTWELYTAPSLTATEDRLTLYRLLESKGADSNAICFVPGIGTTSPLRYAVNKGDEDLVRALLQCGADSRRLLEPVHCSADPDTAKRIIALLEAHPDTHARGASLGRERAGKKRKRSASDEAEAKSDLPAGPAPKNPPVYHEDRS